MHRKSSRIALGGIFSALCLVVMILTILPFSTYAMPALAGAMLFPVVIEVGCKTALMVYASVSLLSLFIVPDREAALLFIVFFGYYAILKEKLEKIRPRWLERLAKLAVFNATVVSGYVVLFRIAGVAQIVEEFNEMGKAGIYLFWFSGNLFFLIYDYVLTRYISLYLHRVRHKLVK